MDCRSTLHLDTRRLVLMVFSAPGFPTNLYPAKEILPERVYHVPRAHAVTVISFSWRVTTQEIVNGLG
jgi:hypothetical protein